MTEAARLRSADTASPYPWGRLDVVTREDVEAARALRGWSREIVRAEEVGAALSALLDARVEVVVRKLRSAPPPSSGPEDGVGVLLGPSETPEVARAVLVELEPALGVTLVARALRRHGPRVIGRREPAEALAGAVAAIVLATGRRVHTRRALRILAAGPARTLEGELTRAGGDCIEASLTVIVNEDAFSARALVPRAVALAPREATWTRASLAGLGDVVLALPVVAAASRSTAGEVGTLRRGDAWLPGGWALRSLATGTLEGAVLLASAKSEVGACVEIGEEGRLVVGEGARPLTWAPAARAGAAHESTGLHEEEEGVTEAEKDALVEAVGEVPVVVRVEIGAIEMRAREWASLAVGDVVALGKRLGEAVTLRVGGVTIARGELVDLDGEVAVRILGRVERAERTDAESQTGHARPVGQEHG